MKNIASIKGPHLALSMLSASAPAAASGPYASSNQPAATVSHVDLARYQGTWYEIASIPQPFESNCIASQGASRQ
jgi:apolipoprotein D and lipocalin family protein